MLNRQLLIDLLKGMETAIPPPARCHHVLSFAQYGSDETGWEDKLALQLNVDGTFQTFFLEAEDEGKSPQQLVAEIAAIARDHPADNVQFGVAPGQYLPC